MKLSFGWKEHRKRMRVLLRSCSQHGVASDSRSVMGQTWCSFPFSREEDQKEVHIHHMNFQSSH